MNINIGRFFVIVLFVLAFTTIGWLTPALYATYAPQDTFIEANSFVAPDTTVNTQKHTVCFDRNIHQDSTGGIIMEMYLVPEEGTPIYIQSTQQSKYFQEGTLTEIIAVNLPRDIEAGEYYYQRIYQMELVNGRVIRTFTFNSNTFEITNTSTPSQSCYQP